MSQNNLPKHDSQDWRPSGLPKTWLEEHDACAHRGFGSPDR